MLTNGALPLGGGRSVVGAGARTTSIRAFTTRVVTADSGPASLSGVNVFGGDAGPAGQGGGIYVGPSGDLDLTASTVSSNEAMTGGGIYSAGDLTVERSSIIGNEAYGATPRGGGLAIADGTATLIDTTISSNYSDATGAGLWTAANVTLRNVTIAGNESDDSVPAAEASSRRSTSRDPTGRSRPTRWSPTTSAATAWGRTRSWA